MKVLTITVTDAIQYDTPDKKLQPIESVGLIAARCEPDDVLLTVRDTYGKILLQFPVHDSVRITGSAKLEITHHGSILQRELPFTETQQSNTQQNDSRNRIHLNSTHH